MAKKSKVASMNPDDMTAGGLPDDFFGTVDRVRLVPWDYNGKVDHHVLAVAVDITPNPESELPPFTQHYSCGSLENFIPATDPDTPVDLDTWDGEDIAEVEGIYAYRVGRSEQLSSSSNWAAFLANAKDSGFDGILDNVDSLEGIYGHFDRISQKPRSGIVRPGGEEKKANDILVLTEIKDAPKAGKAKGAAGKKSTTKKTTGAGKAKAASGGDGLDEKIVNVLLVAIAGAGDDGLPFARVPGLMIQEMGADKGAAVTRATDKEFLAGIDGIEYDPDEAVLTIG